jgi:hypothetical protein
MLLVIERLIYEHFVSLLLRIRIVFGSIYTTRLPAHEQTELNTLPLSSLWLIARTLIIRAAGGWQAEPGSSTSARRSRSSPSRRRRSNTCMCMRCEQASSQPKKTIPIEASDVACSHLQPLKKVKKGEGARSRSGYSMRTSHRSPSDHHPRALMANWRWNGRRP